MKRSRHKWARRRAHGKKWKSLKTQEMISESVCQPCEKDESEVEGEIPPESQWTPFYNVNLIAAMLAMSALPKIHWGYEGPVPMCPAQLRTKGRKHKLGRTGSQYSDTGETEARRDNFKSSLPKQPILSSGNQKPRGTIDPGKDRKLVSDDRVAFAHYKAVIMAREGHNENTNEMEGESYCNDSPVEVVIWKDDKVLILSENSCPENEHDLFWWREEHATVITRDEGMSL